MVRGSHPDQDWLIPLPLGFSTEDHRPCDLQPGNEISVRSSVCQLCSENTESKRTVALTSRWGRRAGEAHEGLAFLHLWDKELPGFRRWLVFSEHASQQLHGQFTPMENAQNPPRVTTNSAVFWNIPVADSSQQHLRNFTEQVSVHGQTLFHCTSLFCASQTFWVFVLFCFIQTEGLWQPCFEQVYRQFSTSVCSLRASVSHFGDSLHVSNIFIILLVFCEH